MFISVNKPEHVDKIESRQSDRNDSIFFSFISQIAFILQINRIFLPNHDKNLKEKFSTGYVGQDKQMILHKLDLISLKYVGAIDLSQHQCIPIDAAFVPIGEISGHFNGLAIYKISGGIKMKILRTKGTKSRLNGYTDSIQNVFIWNLDATKYFEVGTLPLHTLHSFHNERNEMNESCFVRWFASVICSSKKSITYLHIITWSFIARNWL